MTTAEFIIDVLIIGCLILNLYCLWSLGRHQDWLRGDVATALERIRERLRELEGRP